MSKSKVKETDPLLSTPYLQTFWWPSILFLCFVVTGGISLSVFVTHEILTDASMALWLHHHWWVSIAAFLPFFIVSLSISVTELCILVSLPRPVALLILSLLMVVSAALGGVWYGLLNATFDFSFILQLQIFSLCQAVPLLPYAVFGWCVSHVPVLGGYNPLIATLLSLAATCIAYPFMSELFVDLGYPLSRTGGGLWRPWVAFVVSLLIASQSANMVHNGAASLARIAQPA